MPELPEVETVRRGLLPVMEGAVIAQAEVNRPDLSWPLPERMAARLTGKRVTALRRRSKYILADLSSGETLLVHLGMSGRMLISGTRLGTFHHDHPAPQKHDHVVLHMENGARITFNDARRFGAMDLMPTNRAQDHMLLKDLGPEPFGNDFNEPYLAARLSGRRTPIKAALLDQRIVAGLGNIYVCEALHRARIAPSRAAGRIARPRLDRLAEAIKAVLEEAIAAGGSTLRDFKDAHGSTGQYQQGRVRVYGREGEACKVCGTTLKGERLGQRATVWCPRCQR